MRRGPGIKGDGKTNCSRGAQQIATSDRLPAPFFRIYKTFDFTVPLCSRAFILMATFSRTFARLDFLWFRRFIGIGCGTVGTPILCNDGRDIL